MLLGPGEPVVCGSTDVDLHPRHDIAVTVAVTE
jgi:hypothetical protein